MKNTKRKQLCHYLKKGTGYIILLIALVTIFGSSSAAAMDREGVIPVDFGDFNDYDGGDWGSSSFGDSDFGSFSDWDWDDSSSSWGSGSSFNGLWIFGGGGITAVIAIIVVVILLIKRGKGGNYRPHVNRYRPMGKSAISSPTQLLPDRTAQIEGIIRQRDAAFSSFDFITFVRNAFINIQDGWSRRDITLVRPLLHINLYSQTEIQIRKKIEEGIINRIDSISVNTAYLTSYMRDAQYEYVTVFLNAKMFDYQIDEKTGNIIRGNKETRWDMYYKIKLMRSINAVTKPTGSMDIGHNCPNCGAPMKINASGVCEYCGSVVTTGLYEWVICEIGDVRRNSIDEGIRL